MSNLQVKIQFYDEYDKEAFLKYWSMAKEKEGTVTGLYCGIMCSALKRSALIGFESLETKEVEA